MEDLKDLAVHVVLTLTQSNKTLSTAESCTGGLIASSITDISGASKVYLGGFVVYSSELKRKLLKIPKEIFIFGVISREMAEEMARSVKILTGSDFSIATTGNLGPTTMEDKPSGLIYIATASREKILSKELKLNGDRLENKRKAVYEALSLLLEVIK